MHPGPSVSELYFSHPGSKYFGVGQIGRDEVVDYGVPAQRIAARSAEAISPNLDYNVSGNHASGMRNLPNRDNSSLDSGRSLAW